MKYTLGELFAGVGGFSLGFEAAGWQTRWQVESDKHCQQVLARHWPGVQQYGDIRNVAGGDLSLQGRHEHGSSANRHGTNPDVGQAPGSVLQPVSCITFGSPCQDLSLAGKRAGFDGARSGLFFEAIRIIREMRTATTGTFPRFAVWENVPGALSSNDGRDFLAALDALAEVGAVDIAWRVLNAQFFGVPQRRRRVFVVADFGGQCAAALHAEPAGVRWNPTSGRTARQDVAGGVGGGVAGIVNALTQGLGSGGPDSAHACAGWLIPKVVGTLSAGAHPGGFNGQNAYNDQLIVQPTSTVRILTPLECERLNGFPDGHTRWRADSKEQADSQRYRQMGNAVAVPVAQWIGLNLRAALEMEAA